MLRLFVLSLLCAALVAAEDEMERLFEAGKYAEAAAYAKKALESDAGNTGLMYNGGMAAYLASDYQLSLSFWLPLMAIETDNIKLKAKIIQAYEAMGDAKNTEAQLAEIMDMYAKRQGRPYADIRFFTRDQFLEGGVRVMVFQYFELLGDRAVKYSFNVLNKAGEADYKISLGSYDVTNGFMQSREPLPANMRYFHLDGYYNQGDLHRTFGFYKGEPPYAAIRDTVRGIISGKVKAASESEAK